MVTAQQLKLGLVILLFVFALIVAALISAQHLNVLHPLAATAVEYAKVAGHSPAATAVEY